MARKLLSLVVALSVVLSSMSFAFAAKLDPKAVSADVTDAKVKAAVEKLVTLGMVEGIDGKYVPDQKLKRSELTKLIVIALGMGPAADASKGSATQFSDVGADHWAAGYITVAAGQGLVQGMGDGTFAPDSEITFAQALTMLVRALGYKDEFLKGSWPGNYLAKASEKDLDEGVTIVPNAAVKRGDFALMMSNTLDAEIVKINGYENDTVKYTEDTETTLAKEKLKLDKAEVRLTGNARLSDLASDEVSGEFTKDCADDSDIKTDSNKGTKTGGTFTLEFEEGLNPDVFMGITSNIYVKDKDTIVYIESAGISTEYWDGVDKFQGVTETATIVGDLKLRWAGKVVPVLGGEKTYDSAKADDFAKFYRTVGGETTQWTSGYASGFLKGQDYGRFVVENGKVVFADLYEYDNKENGYMVKEIDAEDNSITYYEGDEENTIDFDSKYTSVKFYLEGKELTLKDLKPFDVFYIGEARVDSKDVANIFVFRKTLEGTVSAVITENEESAKKIEVDSKTITDIGKNMTYSYDNNAEIDKAPGTDDLEDFVDVKVTLILDNDKKIRHIYGTTTASESLFGVVLGASNDTLESKIKVYTSNDAEVTYTFEDDSKVFDTDKTIIAGVDTFGELQGALDGSIAGSFDHDANAGTPDITRASYFADRFKIIEYKLTKDGKIAEESVVLYAPSNLEDADVGTGSDDATLQVNGDFGSDSVTINSKTYYVKDDIKIFDIQPVNDDDYQITTWNNFKDKDIDGSDGRAFAIKDGNSNDLKALFLIAKMDGLTKDLQAGYLINTYKNADGDLMATYRVYGSADTFRKEVTGGVPAAITKKIEAAVILNVSSSGKVDIYDDKNAANAAEDTLGNTRNWNTVAGRVYDTDGRKLQVGSSSADYYAVASDALIYNGKDVKTYSNIDKGDFVVAVIKNGTIQSLEYLDIKNIEAPSVANVVDYAKDSKATISISAGYYVEATDNDTNNDGTVDVSVQIQRYIDVENKAVGIAQP